MYKFKVMSTFAVSTVLIIHTLQDLKHNICYLSHPVQYQLYVIMLFTLLDRWDPAKNIMYKVCKKNFLPSVVYYFKIKMVIKQDEL